MSYTYELMVLPSLRDDVYVLVTSRGASVAVRDYRGPGGEAVVRHDGSILPTLTALRVEGPPTAATPSCGWRPTAPRTLRGGTGGCSAPGARRAWVEGQR